jgi:hypothetical protein
MPQRGNIRRPAVIEVRLDRDEDGDDEDQDSAGDGTKCASDRSRQPPYGTHQLLTDAARSRVADQSGVMGPMIYPGRLGLAHRAQGLALALPRGHRM